MMSKVPMWRAAVMAGAAMVLAACAAQTTVVSKTPADGSSATPVPVAPQDPAVQKQKALNAYLAAGIESLKMNDPERARRHITHALEIDRKSPEALNAMALLYKYEGDSKREEDYYRKALWADSDFSKARNNYAGLLFSQRRYEEAIKQLERAVNDENYDQRGLAFLNLGRCYLAVKKYEQAENALQRSLRLNNDSPDALVELADVYRAEGRVPDARTYLDAYAQRARHTARSLWIGIQTENLPGGDKDRLASFEFQLQKMFPDSREYAKWQAMKNGAADDGKPKSKHARQAESD